MDIKIKDYYKEIDGIAVLNHITLDLEAGKIYGFQGKNGSGKSMLFKAICQQFKPTSGDILIDEKSIKNQEYDMRNIGALIEYPAFFDHLSGYENLKLLANINKSMTKDQIHKVLKEVGLFSNKDKKYKKYSLGMKQRLGIAQAYMENQIIVILDEPFNGIDEAGVEDIKKIILRLKNEGKTILISSHYKEDLLTMCDQIFVMENGKIKEEKTDENIL